MILVLSRQASNVFIIVSSQNNVNAPYLRLHVHASMDIRVRARLLIKPKTLYTIV